MQAFRQLRLYLDCHAEGALEALSQSGLPLASGKFQTSMEVTYTNMGPVTILLDSEKKF